MSSASSSRLRLDQLPIEIIRRIIDYIPFESVQSLFYANRILSNYCRDWTIYRDIAGASFSDLWNLKWDLTVLGSDPEYVDWVKFACADSKAVQFLKDPSVFTGSSFVRWAPHLIALHHPILELLNPKDVAQLIPTCESGELLALKFCHLACMLSRVTVLPPSRERYREEIYRELMGKELEGFYAPNRRSHFNHLEPFPTVRTVHRHEPSHDPGSPVSLVMHIAYKAICVMNFEILVAATFPIPPVAPSASYFGAPGVPRPPKCTSIPFSSFMDIPVPFSLCSAEMFGLCHLPRMASPEFIDSQQWSGYCFRSTYLLYFDCIKFVTSQDENISDQLHFKASTGPNMSHQMHFKGTLRKMTGKIDFIEYHPSGLEPSVGWRAMLTPFGIVACCGNWGRHAWLWLWKSEWTH